MRTGVPWRLVTPDARLEHLIGRLERRIRVCKAWTPAPASVRVAGDQEPFGAWVLNPAILADPDIPDAARAAAMDLAATLDELVELAPRYQRFARRRLLVRDLDRAPPQLRALLETVLSDGAPESPQQRRSAQLERKSRIVPVFHHLLQRLMAQIGKVFPICRVVITPKLVQSGLGCESIYRFKGQLQTLFASELDMWLHDLAIILELFSSAAGVPPHDRRFTAETIITGWPLPGVAPAAGARTRANSNVLQDLHQLFLTRTAELLAVLEPGFGPLSAPEYVPISIPDAACPPATLVPAPAAERTRWVAERLPRFLEFAAGRDRTATWTLQPTFRRNGIQLRPRELVFQLTPASPPDSSG